MKYGVRKKAYTAIELLAALAVLMMLVPMMNSLCAVSVRPRYQDYYDTEDVLGLEQLRLYLAGAKVGKKQSREELQFTTWQGEYRLLEVNHKVMMHPGSLTFIRDIEHLSFYIKNEFVMMRWTKKGKTYDTWIALVSPS